MRGRLLCKFRDALHALQAAAKRFKVQKDGTINIRHAGKQHMNEKKSKKRKKYLTGDSPMHETCINNNMGCIPYARIFIPQSKCAVLIIVVCYIECYMEGCRTVCCVVHQYTEGGSSQCQPCDTWTCVQVLAWSADQGSFQGQAS